jgi:hypothetical protein
MVVDSAKEIVDEERIAQAANDDYRPKQLWVCTTPTNIAAEHDRIFSRSKQPVQRGRAV